MDRLDFNLAAAQFIETMMSLSKAIVLGRNVHEVTRERLDRLLNTIVRVSIGKYLSERVALSRCTGLSIDHLTRITHTLQPLNQEKPHEVAKLSLQSGSYDIYNTY